MAPKPVEIDCGIMKFDAATKKVSADTRKGKLKCYINNDGEKKFEWRAVGANDPEIEQYVFEGDGSKFKKVQKSSGRVYLFTQYDEKFFFWLQEKDTTQDEELCKKVNEMLNYQEGAMDAEPQASK
mmetsp:Transcript_15285/g.12975  ORF Transcript_15285/g.12975 Transcript_15285/m.12975 type:complete len:126 (-) Transcript_15285:555-932(-)